MERIFRRFEFIFTNLISGTPRLIASVLNVYKTYNATRLYRELKLRSAIIQNRALKVTLISLLLSTKQPQWAGYFKYEHYEY